MNHYLINVKFYDCTGVTNNSKKYTYKVPKDVHIDIGDEVVVFVSSNAKDQKHHVVRVVDKDLDAQDTEFQYKWIVGKIDTVAYDDLLAKDKEFKGLVQKLLNRKKNKSLVDQLTDVASEEELAKLKTFL